MAIEPERRAEIDRARTEGRVQGRRDSANVASGLIGLAAIVGAAWWIGRESNKPQVVDINAGKSTQPPVSAPRPEYNPVPNTAVKPVDSGISGAKGLDFSISRGETTRINTPSVVGGDVKVNGVPAYDNNENTGLVVVVKDSADITAPWGASGFAFKGEDPVVQQLVDQAVTEMRQAGCANGKGCSGGVTVLEFKGGKLNDVTPRR